MSHGVRDHGGEGDTVRKHIWSGSLEKIGRGRGRPKKKASKPMAHSVEEESGEADVEPIMKKDKKLWVDMISGNLIPANGLVLGYSVPLMVEGKPVVVIANEDDEKELMY
ncbi:unnamed protein product [Vicia faba]|uniref:Uncharacterized protein n=1 Tax=Vicia faba TaxID=3906 RepID=A0AAV1A131_VICFA|nr:unnamed protein product [Vicia faba]